MIEGTMFREALRGENDSRVEEKINSGRELLKTGLVDASDIYPDDSKEVQAEKILANLLWVLFDAENEDSDQGLVEAAVDACVLADMAGIHWRSGR